MSDRPLTLILIAVAILIALYLRRSRGASPDTWVKSGTSFTNTEGVQVEPISTRVPGKEIVTPEQAAREGKIRGIEVNLAQPLTREQFERLMGPVSAK